MTFTAYFSFSRVSFFFKMLCEIFSSFRVVFVVVSFTAYNAFVLFTCRGLKEKKREILVRITKRREEENRCIYTDWVFRFDIPLFVLFPFAPSSSTITFTNMKYFSSVFILSMLPLLSIHAIAIDDFHCKVPTCRDFHYVRYH